MTKHYEVIVIGCGGVGSAALAQLSMANLIPNRSILGIEQFSLGHDRGSSHGRSRIIRQAYFEHPNYVPLVLDAYQEWEHLETQTEKKLLRKCGLLEVGPPDGELVLGLEASIEQHNLAADRWTPKEARLHYPDFHVPDDTIAYFEHDAGILFVDDCVLAQLEVAKRNGVQILQNEKVHDWSIVGNHVEIKTGKETLYADRLLITAGGWSQALLEGAIPRLQVRKKFVHWFRSSTPAYDIEQGAPMYYFETLDGHYYGFPSFDQHGIKLAEHTGGMEVEDPDHTDREIDDQDRDRVTQFLDRYLHSATFEHLEHSTCFYSMSPDSHFIVDHHVDSDRVWFAVGLSGHGFKFTPAIGRALADLVTKQEWDPRVEFLRMSRF